MESYILFIAALLLVVVVSTYHTFCVKNKVNPISYLKQRKGIWTGIKLSILFSIVIPLLAALSGCSQGKYLKEGSIYVGLDFPPERSPQCLSEGVDDKTTSNLGARVNVYTSEDEKFRLNGKYTHHSCAFNSDIRVYDSLGAELEYVIFTNN